VHVLLLILEVVFAAVLVAGVAFTYWPAALVLAGVLGILACERGEIPARGDDA
jgi:hypothetical protein